MRLAEIIQAGFAVILALAAWLFPISDRRRTAVTLLALIAVAAIALVRVAAFVLDPTTESILRDWLPAPLTLIPYWQTGQFFTAPNTRFQAWLLASDRRIFRLAGQSRTPTWIRLSIEWAYALCYPLVPLGLAVLYSAGLQRYADTFWFVVLVPTYVCYALTPFFPALPPRDLESGPRRSKSRLLNLWILQHGSIHAISFPSAHVASALAVALVLRHYLPVAGYIGIFIAFWIAVAAVVGRYHYALDVILGAALAILVYAAWHYHLIPSTLFTAPAVTLVAHP
ncbi:phosphatase PAP2 family protein [Acidobacteria bacterium AB60]|nr:phosphatase PAP2 family protein [Acidobacteria bacterium AB60]